jgi:3-oxoadipate enol-lactonase
MATRWFIDSDGERTYFEFWGDSGDVVVLGHGLGGTHASWYQQVPFLSQRYRVVTWDQRGFGRSTRATGNIDPIPAVRDMVDLFDHLEIDRAHVVGQSIGGWSALGFAIEHEDSARSLTLADTTGAIFTPQIRQTLTGYGEAISSGPSPQDMPLGFHPAVGTQLIEESRAQAFFYTQLSSLTDPPSPSYIMASLKATDHTEEATHITIPTLFIVGEHDPIPAPQLIQNAATIIPGSRVEIVKNTGHSQYFERPTSGTTSSSGFCDNQRLNKEDSVGVREVVSGLYQLSNDRINAFLIDDGDAGLTLIDCGYPKHGDAIIEAIRSIGREPSDLKNILITHAHPDHLGSAKQLSGGSTPISMHPADGDIAKAGVYHLSMKAGPGLLNGILYRMVMNDKPAEFPSFEPDIDLKDGDVVDVAGGIEVVHTPGHTAGHVAFLWKIDRGLLFVGDAAGNLMGLNYMIGYDDIAEGKSSLAKLSGFDFEAAVFGHGRPILSGASAKFSKKFA